MKNSKNKRGFFGRLIVFLFSVLAFVGLLATLMSVLSSYVNPVRFVWFSFFGLTFWVIMFYDLIMLVLLLLMRSRKAWIAVMALLIAIPGIYKSFSTGKSKEDGELRVMSYNVMNFHHPYNKEKTKKEMADGVAEMVKQYDPDVICIQEFSGFLPGMERKACIFAFGEMIDMPYQRYNTKANYGGNVIFSKYPLFPIEENIPLAKENDYGTVARVDAGHKGVFYVICCHLVSFQLTQEEITVFSELNNNKEQMGEYGKSIVSKLKAAFVKRSEEVERMLQDLPNDSRPILLCGDFNDTPMSYTYHQVKHAGFTDGFVEAGRGIGQTYAGQLPLLRIDYVWGNEQIKPMTFKRLRYKGSDHYPVMMDFYVNHGL